MRGEYNMEIFLYGVLNGAPATRNRHIRQANEIQRAVYERWHLENPWSWKRKHLAWFLTNNLDKYSKPTQYYYLLTARLIASRRAKTWRF